MRLPTPIKFRNAITINEIDDFNCIGQDMTEDFAESLMKDERFIDRDHEGPLQVYLNQRAVKLLDRYMTRLYRLAEKIFDESELTEFDVEPRNVIEE